MRDNFYNRIIIFNSRILHKRYSPKKHEFTYKNFYVSLPIKTLVKKKIYGNFILGFNRRALISISDSDHGNGMPMLDWATKILKENNIEYANGEIWLSTFPKVTGIGFKPVSFWFCENRKQQTVAVIVEVNNTFKEREIYVLTSNRKSGLIENGDTITTKKKFYVSPFIHIEGEYNFRFFRDTSQGKETSRIELVDRGSPLILTTISSKRVNLKSMFAILSIPYYVFLPLLTLIRIHWQAGIIWLKGVKLVTKKT
tara:strand:+ start:65 stop:829 length:765 start_codon:yes stop_codon:yes gene_type:complete